MRWVDVRITPHDLPGAQAAFLDAWAPVDLMLDVSGSDIQISVAEHSEHDVTALLGAIEIEPLSVDTRIDKTMELQLEGAVKEYFDYRTGAVSWRGA